MDFSLGYCSGGWERLDRLRGLYEEQMSLTATLRIARWIACVQIAFERLTGAPFI